MIQPQHYSMSREKLDEEQLTTEERKKVDQGQQLIQYFSLLVAPKQVSLPIIQALRPLLAPGHAEVAEIIASWVKGRTYGV